MQVCDYSYDMPNLRQKIAVLMPLLIAHPALAAEAQKLPAWSYEGEKDGQDSWSTLSGAYNLCENGTQQSPINITFTEVSDKLPIITPKYQSSTAHVAHNEHILQINLQDGGTLHYNGDNYTLRYIQFHTPSEHTIQNRLFPIEVQFVHLNKDKKLLIMAAFATIGGAREGFDTMLSHTANRDSFNFDPVSLLPSKGGYYSYTGSITYPPCIEGVQWLVLKEPMSISKEQLQKITAIVKRNARFTQPVYMRKVEERGN